MFNYPYLCLVSHQMKDNESLKLVLGKIRNEKKFLEESLNEAREGRDTLKLALEDAKSRIEELNSCQQHLIKLIQTISIQTLASLV